MQEHIEALAKTYLFKGIDTDSIFELIKVMKGYIKSFEKNQLVYYQGQIITDIAIILTGNISLYQNGYHGDRVLVNKIPQGDIFGEAFVCAEVSIIPLEVRADTSTQVLFINYQKMITPVADFSRAQHLLLDNFIKNIIKKLLHFRQKLIIYQKKTLREKLYIYFNEIIEKERVMQCYLPFNRDQLAEYLGVNRSALSRELGKMKKEGIIDYKRNYFIFFKRILPQEMTEK